MQASRQSCKRSLGNTSITLALAECAVAFSMHGLSGHHTASCRPCHVILFSPKSKKKGSLHTSIMNAGLSCNHNTSIIQRERGMPVLPWKACNLTQNAASPLFFYIVASYLVPIGHIYVYLFSLLFSSFVHRGNTGRRGALSLNFLFSILVCVV